MLYLFSTFIAFVVTVTSAGNCPPGAVDYSEGQECLLGINAPAEYAAAAQTCTMLGGRLVQPRNSLENVLAGSQSIEALHGQAAYLGVRRINGVWRYADGTALAYQNWKNGTGLAGQDCATFRGNDLSWYPDLCTGVRPFICSFSDQLTNGTHGCPSGWKYYRFTQSCYYAPPWNFAAPVSLTLNDGAARCRSVGADLASIHGEKENRFINEMVWSVRENWDVTCSQTQGARYLIGLTFSRGPPEWTDGTLYDYTAVDRAGQPSYGIYNDPICPSTGSWYGAAAQNYAGYVCKKRAVAVVGPTLKEKLAKIEKLATLARLNKMPFVPPTSL